MIIRNDKRLAVGSCKVQNNFEITYASLDKLKNLMEAEVPEPDDDNVQRFPRNH